MPTHPIDRLKRMAVFVEVVAHGSMSAAARHLAMTPSAVSQHLRRLERDLGLDLLLRSTRKLALTEAGERFHVGCAAMLGAAQAAEQALVQLRDEPEGELRLAAPIGFAALIAEALEPLRRFPRLRVRLLLDDANIDLVSARIDLALRVGEQADSSLVARRLGALPRRLCASPAYLALHGHPTQPHDLLAHDWLGGRPARGAGERLELLAADGRRQTLRLEGRVQASQGAALLALCLAGWGVSVALDEEGARALADGRLVPVLPEWSLAPLPVYAITARRGRQPAKVRHALALLETAIERGVTRLRAIEAAARGERGENPRIRRARRTAG